MWHQSAHGVPDILFVDMCTDSCNDVLHTGEPDREIGSGGGVSELSPDDCFWVELYELGVHVVPGLFMCDII